MRRYHIVRLLLAAGAIATVVYLAGRRKRELEIYEGFFDTGLPSEKPSLSACDDDFRSDLQDLVVVLKTGASDSPGHLEYQLSATLRCMPNLVVYSDFSEDFKGQSVIDALEDYSDDIKTNTPEFELWHRLHDNGRDGLQATDFVKEGPKYKGAPGSGNGWKLDKWKFMPMARKTLQAYPQANWYLFMEADTYVAFSNLRHWLPTLDHTKPLYLGNPTVIRNDLFAHGGSGFLISHPAMQTVVDYYAEHESELHELTANHWAGDCVLGIAFARCGVGLTGAWPFFQQEGTWNLDPATGIGEHNRRWCRPLVTLHHMSVDEIRNLYAYETAWMSKDEHDGPFKHSDLFKEMILPALAPQRSRWKNPYDGNDWAGNSAQYTEENSAHSQNELEKNAHLSVGDCRALCESQTNKCQQFFFEEGVCFITAQFGAGRPDPNSTGEAGWIVERVNAYIASLAPCDEPTWEPRLSQGYVNWLHSVSGAADIQPVDINVQNVQGQQAQAAQDRQTEAAEGPQAAQDDQAAHLREDDRLQAGAAAEQVQDQTGTTGQDAPQAAGDARQ